jgi:toxin ParE1/3/4
VKVVFTPLAERNINELYAYIAKRSSEERADAYVGRIIAFCNQFGMFPTRGARRDDVLPGLRVVGFERRVTIAFVATSDALLIEGVFYAGRNFETILRER